MIKMGDIERLRARELRCKIQRSLRLNFQLNQIRKNQNRWNI